MASIFNVYNIFHLIQDDDCQPDVINSSDLPPSNKESPSTTHTKRHLKFPTPCEVYQRTCCIDKCIENLSPKEILRCQEQMKNQTESSQLALIVKEIQDHTILKKNAKNILDHNYNFVIAGHSVCLNAWGLVYNVSNSKFKKAIKHVKAGHVNPIHGNKGKKRLTAKGTSALGWMQHTFDRIGESAIIEKFCYTSKQNYEGTVRLGQSNFSFVLRRLNLSRNIGKTWLIFKLLMQALKGILNLPTSSLHLCSPFQQNS